MFLRFLKGVLSLSLILVLIFGKKFKKRSKVKSATNKTNLLLIVKGTETKKRRRDRSRKNLYLLDLYLDF